MTKLLFALSGVLLVVMSVTSAKAGSVVWGNNASGGNVSLEAFDSATGLLVPGQQFLVPNLTARSDNGRGVALLGNDIYYTTADSGNIYKTNSITHADLGVVVNTGFNGIANIATDGIFLYANDYTAVNGVINKYTPAGVLVASITLSGPDTVGVHSRDGFEVQNNPNILGGATTFIANRYDGGAGPTNGGVVGAYDVYDSAGVEIISGFITPNANGTSGATGIAYDGNHYFVSDINLNRLLEYDGLGAFVRSINLSANPNPPSGHRYLEDLATVGNTPTNPGCGDNSVDPGEECDGGADVVCPGRCFPPGNPLECTCDTSDLCAGVVCTPLDQCHVAGICDSATGVCSHPNAPDGATCSDGNACTSGDTCGGGSCIGTPVDGIACDDGNACTSGDTCGGGSCIGTPTNGIACDDGNVCTTGEICINGACRPVGGRPDCDDGNFCTNDRCDPQTGCIHDSSQSEGLCDNGNPCTPGVCDPILGCVFSLAPAGTPCDDFDPCTGLDRCDGQGGCVGQSVCDDNNPCTDDFCDPASGECSRAPNSNACDDGNACTGTSTHPDFCNGVCVGGEPVNCDDANACNGSESCNPITGCVAGTPPVCDDGSCCTLDGCNPSTGCTHLPNTTPPTLSPQVGCTILWPPQHGYVDFTLADTGITAASACGIASVAFGACHSSQPENGLGVGDGNSVRDCVNGPDGTLSMRAERDGACSPVGRVYSSAVIATDVCGNTASTPFEVAVWHDRGHEPAGPYRSANPGSNQNDTRAGTNGTYGLDCGDGSPCATGQGHDSSDADPEMEIAQNASISVGDLNLQSASGGNVMLTWTEPAHQPGINVTRFHVYRLDPVTLFWTQIAEVTKQTTSYLDSVLNDGLDHQYKITAMIK